MVFRISYVLGSCSRAINIRAPDITTAEHEFLSVYPDRSILSISQVKPFLKFVNMISYLYTLEVCKRGKWRPVFYPPQSTTPIQSEHLPFVQERAELLSSHYTGDKFRIVKTENYLIQFYGK